MKITIYWNVKQCSLIDVYQVIVWSLDLRRKDVEESGLAFMISRFSVTFFNILSVYLLMAYLTILSIP
jgi:hypothetical protein